MSLRLRLTLVYTTFLALVLVVVAAGVYTLTERSLLAQLEGRVDELMASLDATTEDGLKRSLASLPNDAHFEIVIYYFREPEQVADFRDGRIEDVRLLGRANPDPEVLLWPLLHEEDYQRLLGEGELMTTLGDYRGRQLISKVQMVPFSLDNNFRYHAAMLLALPGDSVPPILRQLLINLVTMVVAAFFFFALVVWLLSLQALLPVKRVTEAAARIGSQDLAQRVPVPKTKDEMRDLAQAINLMLERLQESFETQRRFTADASHELRTPVTAIVGHANYLLRRTKPSPEQLESLGVIRSEGERMGKLVSDLLELARADAGFSIDRQPMNLVEVVEGVCKDVRRTAHAEVSMSLPSPIVEVCGDASRLKQVVLNLVQNAVNAGAKHVSMSLGQEKDGVYLEVLDDGPGIPAEAVPHLFERFYRVDSARSTRGNGSGLGLAIVKWIVTQHEGEVRVQSRPGEGTVFTVVLPAYSAGPGDIPPAKALLRV